MDINHDEWLGYGIKKGSIEMIKEPICGIGALIDDLTYCDVILEDEKYLKIGSVNDWKDYGTKNNWISDYGCPIHEKEDANILITAERGKLVHLKQFEEKVKLGDYFAILNKPLNRHHFGYMATNPNLVPIIIDEIKKISQCDSFIDIGCGPASVLKLITNEYKFLYGIDIEKTFIDEAKKLVPHAELKVDSADTYILPDKKMHIFIYNPFDNFTLNNFLKNNIDNILRNDSLVIYNNPFYANHLLQEYGLNKMFLGQPYSIYKGLR